MQKKLLASAWQSYAQDVMSPKAGNAQRIETRRAFYAGAAAFYDGLLAALTPGPEATDGDVRVLSAVREELNQFAAEVKEGRA